MVEWIRVTLIGAAISVLCLMQIDTWLTTMKTAAWIEQINAAITAKDASHD